MSKYLDELGFTVFVGVLDEKGSGAEELRRTCSKHLSVLQMDITDPQQIKDAHSKVVEKVQNRGTAFTCPSPQLPPCSSQMTDTGSSLSLPLPSSPFWLPTTP